jgi:hypothetical protein
VESRRRPFGPGKQATSGKSERAENSVRNKLPVLSACSNLASAVPGERVRIDEAVALSTGEHDPRVRAALSARLTPGSAEMSRQDEPWG